MAPALKAKRIKKSTKPDSKAVAKLKPKWEKPRKSISAQPGVAKIKNVNKRSFDPLKAKRGVVLLKNIPHGFYEEEMRTYFGQFGLVTRVRLARSERTGRSKGFAYIEFKVPEVAQIAAETMNNYIMFKHMLKTVYIPPDKQTHNFFRKDVVFTTDEDGNTSFSSAKTKSIEKAIETINRVPTDEEHAKRLKRNQKALQKQQKKYGTDLSNIMVSGNSSSSDAAPTTEVKAKDSKKKALAAKKADGKKEKKTVTKPDDNKVASKPDVKKDASKKDKKKLSNGVSSSSNGGESLLQGLLDKTFETDTSDDDFKIDHSFNASVEDSDDSDDESGTFADLLAKKLSKKSMDSSFMEASDSDDDGESDDEVDGESDDEIDGESDDEFDGESDDDHDGDEEDDDNEISDNSGDSEDMEFYEDSEDDISEPEVITNKRNNKKKAMEGVASNGAATAKPIATLKRKLTEVATTSTQLDLEAKKLKKSPTNKNAAPSTSKASIAKQEPPKIVMKKKNQKPNRSEKSPLSTTTSSSEPESRLPQTKQKKIKSGPKLDVASKLLTAPPANGKQKMKKAKQGLNAESTLSSSITDTSSERDIPKQKLNLKKAKLNAATVSKPETVPVQVQKEKPAAINLQTKTQNKKNKPAKVAQINLSPKTSASVAVEPVVQKSKKKNKPGKVDQINLSPKTAATTSVEPKVQKQEKKNKQKTLADVESTASKPEPVKMDKKQKKVKAVTSSLISGNGFAKKSIKANSTTTKADKLPEKSSAWSTVSETDGEEPKKPKTKGINANLKTIVHKKKTDNAKPLNEKKVKQTPDELLQLITSKDLKQKNQLKSKKKSK